MSAPAVPQSNIILEGWLTKKALRSGRNWKRRYFMLKNDAMVYYDERPNAANNKAFKPLGLVEVSVDTVVRSAPVQKQHAFEVVTNRHHLVVHADSKHEAEQWREALKRAVNAARARVPPTKFEKKEGWLVKRAVRSGRNWKKRFFILKNARLSYFEAPPTETADHPRGMIEIGPRTQVRETLSRVGLGKKHAFSVETEDRTIYCSAASIEDRDSWITSIYLAVLRKHDITHREAVRVSLWLRKLELQQYVPMIVTVAKLDNFDKVMALSEEGMKVLFTTGKFSMNDARRFQLAKRELEDMKPEEVALLGAEGVEAARRDSTELRLSNRLSLRRSGKELRASLLGLGKLRQGGSGSEDGTGTKRSALSTLIGPATPERRIYTWGDDASLQLGIGSSTSGMTAEPTFVQALKKKTEPTRVVAGRGCMAGISKTGSLFTWGDGPALGLGEGKTSSNRPFLVQGVLLKVRITAVSVGYHHMAAISTKGDLFTWGEGEHGELGQGAKRKALAEPRIVEDLGEINNAQVQAVRCGPTHTIVLGRDGAVYAMGEGAGGRLGLGDDEDVFLPTPVTELRGDPIGQIACGDDFGIAVTKGGQTCYWWGRLAGEQSAVPKRLERFDERPVDVVAAGGETAVFVVGVTDGSAQKDADGPLVPVFSSAYSIGSNALLLGHGDEENRRGVNLVEALEGHGVVEVSVSATHAAARTQDGRLLMWGEDNRGQLGNGYLVNVTKPHATSTVAGFRFVSVSCGVGCTASMTQYDPDFNVEVAPIGNSGRSTQIGLTLARPPPPEETIMQESSELEKFDEMMGSIAELAHMIETQGLEGKPRGLPEGSVEYSPGWVQHTDKNTGRKYYESTEDGTVTWLPPDYDSEDDDDEGDDDEGYSDDGDDDDAGPSR